MLGKYYITCAGKKDGGGAQVHAVFSVMAYARGTGITYVHTPFKRISHNYRDDPDWLDKWEHAFSLGRGEMGVDQLNPRGLRIRKLNRYPNLLRMPSFAPTLMVAEHCHWYCDKRPNLYQLIRPELIKKYRSRSDRPRPRTDCLMIAIHVRRGDVTANRYPDRFTSNAVIARQINQIEDALRNIEHEMHLYSEGAPADFAGLGPRVTLHLNEDIFQSIDAMIAADILVMAKSSLSYVAGILSEGLKLYIPFNYDSPLSDWLISAQDGTLDSRALERGIATLVAKRRIRPLGSRNAQNHSTV